ncbi:aspartyl protease family protein [Labilibaculum euxinus]
MIRNINLFLLLLCFNIVHAKECNSHSISIVKENGKYFATNVKINNNLVYGKFLIDTGSETVISAELAASTGLEFKKKAEISDGYNNKVVFKTKVTFSIDDFHFKETTVLAVHGLDMGIGIFCDVVGIIGSDIMRQYTWSFYDDKIEIFPEAKTIPNITSYNKEKLILQGYHNTTPYLIVGFGTPRATTLFDTGDNCFIQINKTVLDYINPQEVINGNGQAIKMLLSYQNATSETVYSAIKTDKFTLGNSTIIEPIAYVESEEEGWAIGTEFFDYFDVIIDFKKKDFYSKQKKEKYSSSKWCDFGFKLIQKNGDVYISFVWNNSPAYELNIKPNDRVIKIDDLSLEELGNRKECQIQMEINEKLNNDNISIVIEKNDKKIYTYNIKKVNLFPVNQTK